MAGDKQLASLLPYGMTLKFHSFFIACARSTGIQCTIVIKYCFS